MRTDCLIFIYFWTFGCCTSILSPIQFATERAGNLHSLCISLSLQFLPFNIIIRLRSSGGEIAVCR